MIKEIKKMTRRSSAIFRRLFEIDEMSDEGMDEMEEMEEMEEMREEDEDGEAADVDVDAASSALEDLGSALGLDVEVGGGEEESEDDEEEDEIDLGEEDEMREEDEGMHEADEEDEGDVDEVYEIDENVLRREIKRLRNLREGEAADMADQFGGGDDEGDMFVDVDEDDLINALADELGDAPMPQVETRRRNFSARRTQRQVAKL
jgi:hypothetical protein